MKKVLCIFLFLLMHTVQAMEQPKSDSNDSAIFVWFYASTDRGSRVLARVFYARQSKFEEGSEVSSDELYFLEQKKNPEFQQGIVIISRSVQIKDGEICPSFAQSLCKTKCPDPELNLKVLEGLTERYGIKIPEGLDPNNPRSDWEKLCEWMGQKLGWSKKYPAFMKNWSPEKIEKIKQGQAFTKALYQLMNAERRNSITQKTK